MSSSRVPEVAALFLRLGFTAFGGPAAHIALVEEECVRRRQWISRERFLDILGASNLIPGPTSTELVMHVGLARAGWPGLFVAGACFILPAALIVGVIAAVYVDAGSLPAMDGLLRAIKPVALVVVLQALTGLARSAVVSPRLLLLAVAAMGAAAAGVNEAVVLLGAGALHVALTRLGFVAGIAALVLQPVTSVSAAAITQTVAVPSLLAYFAKAGSLVFGSGYVLFAILRTDLVDRYRWVTEGQLLDAIAVGQVTPGPVFTAATFLGYLLGGPSGAIASTAGIFLPAFVGTAISATLLGRLSGSPTARAFLSGVNAAAVALIGLVTIALGRAAIVDMQTASVATLAAIGIGVFRLNSAWLLAAAAAAGLLMSRL